MSEDGFTGSVGTYAAEIGVVERRLSVFVDSGIFGCVAIVVEVGGGRSVPCYAEPVNVEQAVSSCDLMLCCHLIWVVGDELG